MNIGDISKGAESFRSLTTWRQSKFVPCLCLSFLSVRLLFPLVLHFWLPFVSPYWLLSSRVSGALYLRLSLVQVWHLFLFVFSLSSFVKARGLRLGSFFGWSKQTAIVKRLFLWRCVEMWPHAAPPQPSKARLKHFPCELCMSTNSMRQVKWQCCIYMYNSHCYRQYKLSI